MFNYCIEAYLTILYVKICSKKLSANQLRTLSRSCVPIVQTIQHTAVTSSHL